MTQGRTAATAINAVSNQTGVTAVADASHGRSDADRSRRPQHQPRRLLVRTAVQAQAIQNATGLDVSAGANATGHEVNTLTFGAGNLRHGCSGSRRG